MSDQEASGHAASGRRVHWLELFFDLVMVVYIGQIAHRMHGAPSWLDALAFFVLLAAAWWAWVNATLTMNLFGARVTPTVWVAVTVAMAAIGLMAAAVPEAFGDRAAAFAVGNAVIRLIWMLPWLIKRRTTGTPWWRPVLYNVVPATLWLVSIAVPPPWRFVLWGAAVAIEILLLSGIERRSVWLRRMLDIDHALERVGLLVVIVFGESVLSIIGELTDHWTASSAATAGLAFLAVVLLAWLFFVRATASVERGLHQLESRGRIAGLRDAVMYLPFFLIAGVVLFAAGLGTAVADAEHHLPLPSALCLAGGVSLYFATSTAESLRYGAPWRNVVLWGPAGVVLPWLVVPLSAVASAMAVVGASALIIALMVALGAINGRLMAARAAAAAGGTVTRDG
ncbi:MAG TPA: low temperature requirement protein A [Microbacterium sp.]|nr:low temperature requirement protein A [Microbacterium sp.]